MPASAPVPVSDFAYAFDLDLVVALIFHLCLVGLWLEEEDGWFAGVQSPALGIVVQRVAVAVVVVVVVTDQIAFVRTAASEYFAIVAVDSNKVFSGNHQ